MKPRPLAVALGLLLCLALAGEAQDVDHPYVPDELVPCWLACVTPYGGDTRMINGREYRLATCYLSGPGECTCVWVST